MKELTWSKYKSLKSSILERISRGDLSKAIESIRNGDVASVAALIIDAMSGIDSPVFSACVEVDFSLDDLPLSDVEALVAAVARINPIQRFIEIEKNSPSGGLLLQAMKAVQMPAALSIPATDGGLE